MPALRLTRSGKLRVAEAYHSVAINDWLSIKGWYCLRTPSCVLRSQSGKPVKIGRNGIPDWLCLRSIAGGCVQAFWREDKALDGRVSKEQELMHAYLRGEGFVVAVPYGFDAFLAWYVDQDWDKEMA
jgi:hypothetical protein